MIYPCSCETLHAETNLRKLTYYVIIIGNSVPLELSVWNLKVRTEKRILSVIRLLEVRNICV